MVSIMLTTIRLPFVSAPDMGEDPHPPKTLTAYHTPFSIENGLFTSKTGKHDAYHGKHHAYHVALPRPMSQKRLLPTIEQFRLKIYILTS